MTYRCGAAKKNSANPVTTCQNQSVVSSCRIIFMWPRNNVNCR